MTCVCSCGITTSMWSSSHPNLANVYACITVYVSMGFDFMECSNLCAG